MPTQVGIISDTHGLLRPQAIAALQHSDLILHAGDIGSPEILEELRTIAPIVAVRGNNDREDWANSLPIQEQITIEGISLQMLHIAQDLVLQPGTMTHIVVSGHSHKPAIVELNDRLYINPGSAGPRRFKLPVAIAQLHINGTAAQAEIIELSV